MKKDALEYIKEFHKYVQEYLYQLNCFSETYRLCQSLKIDKRDSRN